MREIKITHNENEEIKASEFIRNLGEEPKLIMQITGKEVTDFLNSIQNNPIKGTEIINENTKIIVYDKYYITLKEYQKLQKLGLLDEYFEVINKYEKEKIESLAPVVTRENKHHGGRIISGLLAAMLILTTAYVTIRDKKDRKKDIEINHESAYEQVDENIDDSTIKNELNTPKNPTNIMSVKPIKNNEEKTSEEMLHQETETTNESIVIEELEETNNSNYVFIEYQDRSNYSKAVKAKELYGEIIEKYAKMYGLDPKLVLAVATQERGVHSTTVDRGGGLGLMQLQKHIWVDYTLTAYNHETGQKDKIHITLEKLRDCETNIQLGCMILQTFMKQNNYNILLGLQAYNMGTRGVGNAVKNYANETNQTKEDVINNPLDCGWLNYREGIAGDPLYVEHVLSYIGSEFETYVYKTDGTRVTCNVRNHEQVLNR